MPIDKLPLLRRLISPDPSLTDPLYRATVFVLCATAVLIAVVAALARFNSFPDELLHITTASFYLDHWLPPRMNMNLRPYVGAHGVSYFMLWPPQAAYVLYAKASQLLAASDGWRWNVYRGLSVVLWICELILILPRLRRHPALFLLVGLTPQVWYVFTYFSPDALSYFAASAVVLELGVEESAARRFLATGRPWRGALTLGTSVGLLALSKMNFMTFAFFAAIHACIVLWRSRSAAGIWRRAVLTSAIAIVVAGPFLVADAIENHEARAHFDEMREALAAPGFRPSDVAAGRGYYGVGLKQRGVSAFALFARPWQWSLFTYRSFFGLYGQMDIFSPPRLNGAQRLLAIAFCLWLVWRGRRRPLGRDRLILVVTAVSMIAATFGSAFWRSWVFDFQAQGRYVFAVIPILALLLTDVTDSIDEPPVWMMACALTLAGIVSLASALPQLSA